MTQTVQRRYSSRYVSIHALSGNARNWIKKLFVWQGEKKIWHINKENKRHPLHEKLPQLLQLTDSREKYLALQLLNAMFLELFVSKQLPAVSEQQRNFGSLQNWQRWVWTPQLCGFTLTLSMSQKTLECSIVPNGTAEFGDHCASIVNIEILIIAAFIKLENSIMEGGVKLQITDMGIGFPQL